MAPAETSHDRKRQNALRRFHANGFDPVDELTVGLACCGYELRPGARILDFGCGTGDFVYRLRDHGFDSYGFDIHDVVKYRTEEDRALFRFCAGSTQHTANMTFDSSQFTIPFDEDDFQLVFSAQTLEHVMDLDVAMREIARVLIPGGISLHIYPRPDALIEPHFLVPLAGRIQSWWWLYFWALLGVRNSHQQHLSAKQTADQNAAYCQTGIHYRTDAEMMAIVGNHFTEAAFVDHLYYVTASPAHRRRAVLNALKGPDRFAKLAPFGTLRVLRTTSRKPGVR